MANWSTLKAAIARVIKNNGNQEITGQVLQNVLNNIVSSIGENATFAGVATPSTNPGTPDGNVFYITGTAGTYPNFGNRTINAGLTILSWNGSSWSATTINTTQVTSEFGKSDSLAASQNLVTKANNNTDYFICNTGVGTGQFNVSKANYVFELSTNCRIVVKMTYACNTNNAQLIVNGTGLKPLYYNGALANKDNTWAPGDVLDVYYDGNNFHAFNIEGGAGAGGNMILEWNTDVPTTRLQVSQYDRKAGLQISYKDPENGWINEQYVGTSFTDTNWVKDYFWSKIPAQKQLNELDGITQDNIPVMDGYEITTPIAGETCIVSVRAQSLGLILDVIQGKSIYTNYNKGAFTDNDGVVILRIGNSNSYLDSEKEYVVPQGATKFYTSFPLWAVTLDDLIFYGDGIKNAGIVSHVMRLVSKELSWDNKISKVLNPTSCVNLLDYKQGYTKGRPDGTRVEYDITFNHFIPLKKGVKYYHFNYDYGSYRTMTCTFAIYDAYKVLLRFEKATQDDKSLYSYTPTKDCFVRIVTDKSVANSGMQNEALTEVSLVGRNVLLPEYKDNSYLTLPDDTKPKEVVETGLVDMSNALKEGKIRYESVVYDHLNTAERFFAQRAIYVDSKLVGCENVIWVDNNEGLDDNNGLTPETAIKTLVKLKEVISNKCIVRFKRGSVFRDDYTVIDNLDTVRFESYGFDTEDLPTFTCLSILTAWEKVAGYNTIYRCPVHMYSVAAERGMTMIYVDGHRIDDVYDHANLEETAAMTYLQENPDNSCWCSCGKYSDGWEEGDYYYYISLSDSPSNHTIEGTRYFGGFPLRYNNKNISLINIKFRGGGLRDGFPINGSEYIFLENCVACDHQHHGILFGKACFYNCTIQSEWAIGHQYHYFLDSQTKDAFDIIISNCKCLLGCDKKSNYKGQLISGHTGTVTSNYYYNRLFVENFYAEGGEQFLGLSKMQTEVYCDKITLKDIGCLLGIEDKQNTILNRVRARIIKRDNSSGYYGMFGSNFPRVKMFNSLISFDKGNSQVSYILNGANPSSVLENSYIECRNTFFYMKNFANTSINKLINIEDSFTKENCKFINCIFAAEQPLITRIYCLALGSVDNYDTSETRFYGMKRLTTDEDVENPFDDLKKKEFMNLMYVDNGVINNFEYE